eukprot:TRINITY_DN16034_c0_g2_i4.p1 TRINITY_DN16034_c0_g2~~TRINITY_DN16034_c0_g2_i4.p1  ORF type:complete len:138 (+),score=8.82 TRINITY_DN16034_c0_g2_i4:280-693(+)
MLEMCCEQTETGIKHKPLLLNPPPFLGSSFPDPPSKYGELKTFIWFCRKSMYLSTCCNTDAVSVFPKGQINCCKAITLSPSFSFFDLTFDETSEFRDRFVPLLVVLTFPSCSDAEELVLLMSVEESSVSSARFFEKE